MITGFIFENFKICVILFFLQCLILTKSMDQKVSPSCSESEDVCEFTWSIEYGWTMIFVNKSRAYGEPVVIRDGEFYRRNVLNNELVCENYEKMTEKEKSETIFGDGQYTMIYTINQQYPSPNIVVYEGQTVVVHVTNNLINEGLTIHWHGLEQRGTPYMDGVPMVTQYPINPGETFTYRFKADPRGTHWYHSHFGVTRSDGLYGAIVVLPRQKRTDVEEVEEDFLMFVQDAYNEYPSLISTVMQKWFMLFYMNKFDSEFCSPAHRGIEGISVTTQKFDSAVINGKGHKFDKVTGKPLIPEIPLENFVVLPNKFYKFRIINSGMLHPFRVSIDNHPLTVVAVDGNDIQPMTVESVIVHNGERFDVMIHTNEAAKKYWIRAETLAIKENDGITMKSPDYTHAILTYKGATEDNPTTKRDLCTKLKMCLVLNCHYGQESADAVGLNQKCLDVSDMKASDDDIQIRQLPMPSEGDDIKEIFLNFHFSKDLPYPPSVNGREFTKPAFPFLLRPYEMGTLANLCDKLSCIRECRCQHVVKVKKGQIVQLILNNSDDQKKGMVHPIHLHGQSFHVLKTAYPSYDSTFGTVSEINPDIHFTNFYTTQRWNNTAWQGNSIPKLNLVNPPRKDVMTIPRKGYVIIRFRADNPGFWFMHCHKETHVQLGMALVLQVGDPEDLPPLPQDFPVCSPPQPYKVSDTGLLQNNLATNMKVTNLAEQVSEDTSENTESTLSRTPTTIYPIFIAVLTVVAFVQFVLLWAVLNWKLKYNKSPNTQTIGHNSRTYYLEHDGERRALLSEM